LPQLTRPGPASASVRASGWPVRRMPRWVILCFAGLLAVAVAVALVHKPSQAERATDLRGFLQDVTTDIESCAAGVGESLTALREVQGEHYSNATNISAGVSVAEQGAANCEPANNEQIDDLESYQVSESLDSFKLVGAVTALVTWAVPDAERVQTDVANVLSATTSQARSQAQVELTRALAVLDAQRKTVYGPINAAIKALAVHSAPPQLPG
jgi:hypothetical protein